MFNCPRVFKFFAKAEAWFWFDYTKIQQQQEDKGYTLPLKEHRLQNSGKVILVKWLCNWYELPRSLTRAKSS